MITSLDLVELQLRVAAGEPLPLTQDEVEIRGHSIEIRINAEDVAGGKFLPSPGPITKLLAPDGFGVRFDSGYHSGDEISQFYDNLVGKLIVWGRDRDTAIRRVTRALQELVVEGVATTIPADLAIVRHPDFAAVEHSTKWVEDVLDLTGVKASVAPAAADGEEEKVRRDVDVEVNGKRFAVSAWVPASAGAIAPAGGGAAAPRRSQARSGSAVGGGTGDIVVPMQGTIVKVLVGEGDTVESGDTVCVLEAMKMENNISADVSGTVTDVKVDVGDSVGSGDVIVHIDPA
ncbi:MAG: biotin/lipoyl-containing protein [Acidimicrobiales bacterium]